MKANNGFDYVARDAMASKTLQVAVRFWFMLAVIAQWIFASYIIAYYGGSAVRGDMDMWNKVFPRGYVAGDALGNFFVALHIFSRL